MSQGRAQSASSNRSILRNFFVSPRIPFYANLLKWIVFISALATSVFTFYLLNKNNLEKEQEERFALILASIDTLERSLTKETQEITNLFNSQIYGPIRNLEDPILKSLKFDKIPSLKSVNIIKSSNYDKSLQVLPVLPDSEKIEVLDWQESPELKEFSDAIAKIKFNELLTSFPKIILPKVDQENLNIAVPFTFNFVLEDTSARNLEPTVLLLTFDKHSELSQHKELLSLSDIQFSLFDNNNQSKNPFFQFAKEINNKPNISLAVNVSIFSNVYELRLNYYSKLTNYYQYTLLAIILIIGLLLFYCSEYIIRRNKDELQAINQIELNRLKKYVAIREKQLHLLTDHAPIGIMLCDKDGIQLSQNKIFYAIMKNLTPDSPNPSWQDTVSDNDKERVKREWNLAVREKKVSDISFLSQSNSNILINLKIHPIEFESTKVGLLVFVSEVVDQKNDQSEEFAKQSTENIPEHDSNEYHSDQFHITPEKTYSAEPLQEEQFSKYQKLHNQNEQENSYSKFENEEFEEPTQIEDLEIVEASVVNILKEVIELLHHKARIKGVKLGVQISATAPTTLQLSPWLLKLSLIELIDSAIERIENGTIRIIYSTKGELARPYFSIKDNSEKSSLTELQNIGTNNYEKALPTLTRENAATFSISELEPQGNKVSLILNQKRPSNYTKIEPLRSIRQSSRKALVLENDTILRERLRELLRLTNVECCFANNDKEASLFLNRDAVDFIFVNSEMDQDALLQLIKISSTSSKKLPILSITENRDKLTTKNSDIKFINAKCSVSDLNNILNRNKS